MIGIFGSDSDSDRDDPPPPLCVGDSSGDELPLPSEPEGSGSESDDDNFFFGCGAVPAPPGFLRLREGRQRGDKQSQPQPAIRQPVAVPPSRPSPASKRLNFQVPAADAEKDAEKRLGLARVTKRRKTAAMQMNAECAAYEPAPASSVQPMSRGKAASCVATPAARPMHKGIRQTTLRYFGAQSKRRAATPAGGDGGVVSAYKSADAKASRMREGKVQHWGDAFRGPHRRVVRTVISFKTCHAVSLLRYLYALSLSLSLPGVRGQ